MSRSASGLVVLGALLTAVGVVPVRLIEGTGLPNVTSSYVLMMLVPAALALGALAYQRYRGVDLASIVVVILVGAVMSTIPFWGPSLDRGMQMNNAWIGTILAHYAAGVMVMLGGLLQLSTVMSGRSEPRPG